MPSGLILEGYRFKDISHERVFGSAPSDIEIKPLGRDTSNIPVIYQGQQNTCVACSITWVKQWMEASHPRLSWPFLADEAHIGPNGAAPSQVLEPARKTGICSWDTFSDDNKIISQIALAEAAAHKIPGYSFITDYSRLGLYVPLTRSLLAIGVMKWKGGGDHMMVAYDVTDDGSALKAKSWWNEDHQTEEIVQFEQVEVAVSFAGFPTPITPDHSISFIEVLIDNFVSFFKYAI